MQYTIPKEIKSKNRLKGFIHFEDLFILLGLYIVLSQFQNRVFPTLTMLYTIVSILFALFLITPSLANPKKKIYHTLFLAFKKKVSTIYSIRIEGETNDEIS